MRRTSWLILLIVLALITLSFSTNSSALLAKVGLALEAQKPSIRSSNLDQLVDVDGHRLHIKCLGTGSPTVILEAGLGDSSRTWDKVMPKIGKFTCVCAYDRAGLGNSDRAPRARRRFGSKTYIELRTGEQSVQDLHTLLQQIGKPGPYVLVGHSFGGLFAILYANRYPKDVVGMVLVDSSHEDQIARNETLMNSDQTRRYEEGLAQNREGFDVDEVMAEVRATRWQTDMPLYVLARGVAEPPPPDWSSERWAKRDQVWREMQTENAQRSTKGKLIIAKKSGHDIQDDQPKLVIDAIKHVVDLAKK